MKYLPGIEIKKPKLFVDERGFFSEIMRNDWSAFLDNDAIIQTNLSMSYPGMIRAWHRHHRGQVDYFLVLKGAMKICAYDDRPDSPTNGMLSEVYGSADDYSLIRIPGYYWHGTKNISNDYSLTVYFTTRMYDYDNPDEERRPWNDPKILDPKTKTAYDWNNPPHK